MSDNDESSDIRQVETLLDVVFGVVIGLPLLELPAKVISFVDEPTTRLALPLLLLLSALTFAVFYWSENHHFLAEQAKLNRALEAGAQHDPGVSPIRAVIVLGGLLMIVLAASGLVFAKDNRFRPFLVVNLVFWLCDVLGTTANRLAWKSHTSAVDLLRNTSKNDDFRWFWGHMGSSYFQFYGAGNAAVFAAALAGDYVSGGADAYRFAVASALVLITAFRHVAWRWKLYDRWLKRWGLPNVSGGG
ncbi:MAG: hypothetical protein ABR961_14605 [Thermoanaerobaculaceae bacterium]|jgi:hypothetical protein